MLVQTYTGAILVAGTYFLLFPCALLIIIIVNPYREIDIYTPDIANMYSVTTDKTSLPPHVFAGMFWGFFIIMIFFKNKTCNVLTIT